MAATVYTRTLPNLTLATRREAYRRISTMFDHLFAYNIDLVSITFDVPTRVLTITLTDPLPAGEEAHLQITST